jgi:SnoaL-like domain
MKKILLGGMAALVFATPRVARATHTADTAMGDAPMYGPMTRLPKDEKKDKKEIEAFNKAFEDAAKKGDLDAMASMVDFPVIMMTDNSKGVFSMVEMTHDQWIAAMKPSMDKMKDMKDMKMSHKATIDMFSDDLGSCDDEVSMKMGKMKGTYRGENTMIRVNGAWKIKTMMEAGWGDMKLPDMPGPAKAAMP